MPVWACTRPFHSPPLPRHTSQALWKVNAPYTAPITGALSGFGLVNFTYPGDSRALYDRTSPFSLKRGYSLVNLRLGVTTRTGWEGAIFVSNLLNKIGETDLPTAIAADLPNTRRYAITQPRTIGVSVSYKY